MNAEPAPTESALGADRPDEPSGLGSFFFEGLPSMTGIVAVISQPFAQDTTRAMFHLPEWMPMALALVVSALLAVYRVRVVRHFDRTRSLILIPLLSLVVFSAYATGNNLVYFAKEGYSRPQAAPAGPSREELETMRRERDLLREQLASAQGLIGTLRQAMGVPASEEGAPRSALPSWLARLPGIGPTPAQAQAPKPTTPTPETAAQRKLREALEKYDAEQRKLKEKLLQLRKEGEQGRKDQPQQQQPLLKSW